MHSVTRPSNCHGALHSSHGPCTPCKAQQLSQGPSTRHKALHSVTRPCTRCNTVPLSQGPCTPPKALPLTQFPCAMTLIHLFRKYKAWNPVHATGGAFWGFGVGLGCGVGWGPGFGPEVIGYVGSGCGVGLSVGFTLVGVGVGLPADGIACLPWHSESSFRCWCLAPLLGMLSLLHANFYRTISALSWSLQACSLLLMPNYTAHAYCTAPLASLL